MSLAIQPAASQPQIVRVALACPSRCVASAEGRGREAFISGPQLGACSAHYIQERSLPHLLFPPLPQPYGRPVCDTDSPCFTHAKHARNMRETCETPCVTCAKHVRNMREMSRNVCETCETADAMHAKHPRNMCEMCETAGAKCGNGRYCKYTKPKVWKSSHAKGS